MIQRVGFETSITQNRIYIFHQCFGNSSQISPPSPFLLSHLEKVPPQFPARPLHLIRQNPPPHRWSSPHPPPRSSPLQLPLLHLNRQQLPLPHVLSLSPLQSQAGIGGDLEVDYI